MNNREYNNNFKCWCLTPEESHIDYLKKFRNYMGSVEWQSAHIIHEKYKRSMDLNHFDLKRLQYASHIISEKRKENDKLPNVDFLTQEVGKFLKDIHNDQKNLELTVNTLLNFE